MDLIRFTFGVHSSSSLSENSGNESDSVILIFFSSKLRVTFSGSAVIYGAFVTMQIPPIAIQIELEQHTSVVIHAKSFISEFMSKFCIKIFHLYEFQDQISKN